METLTSSAALPIHHRTSNYDEASMHQSLLFADSLKDLKNLRTQLYSAAEYFELSFTNDDQKQLVIDTLKDYAIKALVNTVDHLGSVTYKVNNILDRKIEEVAETEFHVSCIEQRLRTCQEYIGREGIAEQSSIIDTPKFHKRYVLPAGQTMNSSNLANLKYKSCGIDEDDWLQLRSAVRATIRDTLPSARGTPPSTRETSSTIRATSSFVRRGRSTSPAPRPSQLPASFSFAGSTPRKEHDKRSVSPHRFPLLRSGSFASRPTTPKSSRPTTPNSSLERHRYISDSWKSVSMRVHDEKEKPKEIERHPSKSKRLLKALLSRRKSKKDETLFTFLDEY
ncbi:protein ABIL2 isoform X1 [Amaranthus tricolor]|uniref:protein ABIL2 isoform X1 n=1 Tax=Amaranthus tricolor TaxID=29722 RepID=UPI0025890BB4|nr:protein ABIL2 isoform X1 [Amaranthus tricolor]XP_057527892.1 protein ABIL2 isoform X1 [Amaranthus tricolor]